MARLNKNIDELVELVKQNRARRRAQRDQWERGVEGFRSGNDEEKGEEGDDRAIDFSTVRVVLFARQSPFTQSVLATLARYTVARLMDEPEETLTFCADYEIDNIILDLDSPSDCDSAMDVFAALKILRPCANVFVCSKSTISIESRALVSRGGIRLTKPLMFKDVDRFVHKYVKPPR